MMNKFFKLSVILFCAVAFDSALTTNSFFGPGIRIIDDGVSASATTIIADLKVQYGKMAPAMAIESMVAYLKNNPTILLHLAEGISNSSNWIAVGRAVNFEGLVLQAVMITYGLPLPVGIEESLLGKKEHMRDAILFAMAKHRNFRQDWLLQVSQQNPGISNAEHLKMVDQYFRVMFDRIYLHSITPAQMHEAQEYVQKHGTISLKGYLNNGQIPVRPSNTPLGHVPAKRGIAYYLGWDSAEDTKKEREWRKNSVEGAIDNFTSFFLGTWLTFGLLPMMRIYYIFDINRSHQLLERMSERIIANIEMVRCGLPKTASLSELVNNRQTTPLEALCNYCGLTRERLKTLNSDQTRLYKNVVDELFKSLKLNMSEQRACDEICQALTTSANPPAVLEQETQLRARRQAYAVAQQFIQNPRLINNAITQQFRAKVLVAIIAPIAMQDPKYKDLPIFAPSEAEIKTILGQAIQSVGSLEILDIDAGNSYAMLEKFHSVEAPFFFNLMRLESLRQQRITVLDAANPALSSKNIYGSRSPVEHLTSKVLGIPMPNREKQPLLVATPVIAPQPSTLPAPTAPAGTVPAYAPPLTPPTAPQATSVAPSAVLAAPQAGTPMMAPTTGVYGNSPYYASKADQKAWKADRKHQQRYLKDPLAAAAGDLTKKVFGVPSPSERKAKKNRWKAETARGGYHGYPGYPGGNVVAPY